MRIILSIILLLISAIGTLAGQGMGPGPGLGKGGSGGGGSTQIATDNFDDRTGALGNNWSTAAGLTINASHQVTGNGISRWIGAGTFTNDQYAECFITAGPQGVSNGCGVRGQSGTLYGFYAGIDYWYDAEIPAEGWDLIVTGNGSYIATPALGGMYSYIRVEIVSMSLTVKGKVNVGDPWTTLYGPTTVTGNSTGVPMIFVGQGLVDNWSAGNIP